MRVMGIDPGYRITGFGFVEVRNLGTLEGSTRMAATRAGGAAKVTYLASGCVRVPESDIGVRLRTIYDSITEAIRNYRPDSVAIEQVFMSNNANSAIKLGHARAAALLACAHRNLSIAEYSALQIKRAVVGRGHAEKGQVAHMVKALLQLPGAPQKDAADALACAICHAHHASSPGQLERRRRPRLRMVRAPRTHGAPST